MPVGKRGGSEKGERRGGRQKGSLNKKTLIASEKLDELGVDPLEILATIASGRPLEGASDLPTLDQRKQAAEKLMPYIYPTLKSIEHKNPDGTGVLEKLTITFK